MVQVLFDHNMPPPLARAMHEIIKLDGHATFPLRDKFPIDIEDIDYFDQLGAGGHWIVISKDLENSRKKAERAAIMRNKILAFYLAPALQKKNVFQQAGAILWQWENMLQQRKLTDRGLFQIPEGKGKFRQL